MNSYFKVFGLAVDDQTGEPDYGYVKVSIEVTVEQLAKLMNVDLKNITQITKEEYERDKDNE